MEKIISQLENKIKKLFHKESSGHSIYHLKRVLNIALELQKKEGGDRLIIGISAFLHDIHRIIQKETGQFCSGKDSLPRIREILNEVELSLEQKNKILHCIEFHEEYDFTKNGQTVDDIETLILQDADNLDAIGAIGIGRTFSFGGAHGLPMWKDEKPFDQKLYDISKNDPSTIHHFYNKLLKLENNMNTKTARKMAHQRHKFMKKFLKQFFAEWKGKK
ncbi:HD domain-containing protein [bacterium]|nr:HD domain-containing protein [bacterium]